MRAGEVRRAAGEKDRLARDKGNAAGETQHAATEKDRAAAEKQRAAGAKQRGWRHMALFIAARLGLVVVLVVALLELQAGVSYMVPSGSVEFRVRPAWPGGRLIMPLGPAGEFRLHTHRTPLDIIVDYKLPAETQSLGGPGGAVQSLPGLKDSAREAFVDYLWGRIPWIVLVGVAAGALVAGSWRRRRLAWGAVAGAVAVAALGGAVAVSTYVTVDRTPSIEYRGLASNVPRVLPLVRTLGGEGGDQLGGLQDYVNGLETVARELTVAPQLPERSNVVRLLLAGDVHNNVFGMRAAARLAAGGGEAVDGVLLAGDLTDRGTRQEAQLFLRVFDAAGAPVVMVGGNHEDAGAMRTFEAGGYRVLEGEATTIAGVGILGASDPLARSRRVTSDPLLLTATSELLLQRWRDQVSPAQILLVHDVREAEGVIAAAREAGEALIVAYGNDHVAGVRTEGSVTLVDAGTAGASGYQAVGAATSVVGETPEPSAGSRDDYTFQLLDFSREAGHEPLAVTTLIYSGSGRIGIEYTPLGQ